LSAAAPAEQKNQPAKPGSYEVARPGGKCAVSGQPIAPKQKFYAALRETAQGFEWIDILPEHWADFDKTGLLGFWQTVMPEHEAKKKLFVDDEVLCGLFERLAAVTEPAKVNFRFVLGLILMRKRLLVYENTRKDDLHRDIWTMRFKGKEQTLDMVDPHLDESQMKEVSGQLSEILNEEV
jgi:hypothetical protein